MDRITAMRVFAEVVDSGSQTAAAENLDMSRAMVTRYLAELEQWLGERLLHRTTRRLSLTDAGRAYFDRCVSILAELDDAESEVGTQQHNPTGLLRITAPIAFGAERLGQLLAGFRAQYPAITLDVSLADRMVDLVEEGIDVALRITNTLESTLIAKRLTTVRLVVCAAPAYLAQRGTPSCPQDLVRHDCLSYTNTLRSNEWIFNGPKGREVVTVSGGWRANSGELLRNAALNGEGIVCQPTFLVGEDLKAGRLIPLLGDFPPPDFTMYAVYVSRRHMPAKVRACLDYLATHISDPPSWDTWVQMAGSSQR